MTALLQLPLSPFIRNQAAADKVQPFLAELALTDPNDVVAVIVQKQNRREDAEVLLTNIGGQVTDHFPLINGFAAQIPAAAISALAASPAVRYIALDAPVMTMNERGLTAVDDFATVDYNGSGGGYAWAGAWQEIGESDGAALGDVAVVPFWGGALQGLRLQGADRGAQRVVNLTTAATAELQLTYRRKSFEKVSDFVAVEVSTDGGATWQTLGRLSGPATDAALQAVSFDLTPYRAATTTIRFLTSPALSETAKFYLDIAAIELTMADNQQAVAANTLYLPLVTNEQERPRSWKQSAALVDKRDLLAHARNAPTEGCTWYCIDLAKVASPFLKAIGADQLWNNTPYLRGQGVTIAVVDSGIAYHPDLNDYSGHSRVITQVNFVHDNMLPDDYYGHGTHVAGTMAGLGQASDGLYLGVAPEAHLIDVRVMNDRGHGNTSSVIEGLQWVYDHQDAYGIQVVNLSLNSRIPESYHQSALNAALEVLWFNNIVVVVSAGNGGKQRLYPPANDPFVITIGSANDQGTPTIDDDTLSTFSAYGMTADGFLKPDLVAPGGDIVSLLASDDSNLLAAFPHKKVIAPNNSTYFKMSGTSMASAVAAGAAALLLEDEPDLTPDQVKYRLVATAKPFQGPESCAVGAGYLDLYGAVQGTTTASANTGLTASALMWDGLNSTLWGSVSWNSVSWNSVSWNSVSWNSVSWNSVSWNSVSWNSSDTESSESNGSCVSAIAGVTLVNEDTGEEIQPLYDGAVVNLDAVGTTNLSVRADVVGQVESVKFTLTGSAVVTQVHNSDPYRLTGYPDGYIVESYSVDADGNGLAPLADSGFAFGVGRYDLNIAAFTADEASGVLGGQMDLEFVMAGATRCEVEPLVRPVRDLTPITLQIQNDSSEPLELFRLGDDGQRISAGSIAPYETKTQTTFATHPWLLARATDQSCLYLIPDAGDEPEVIYQSTGTIVSAPPAYIYDDPYYDELYFSDSPTETPEATTTPVSSEPSTVTPEPTTTVAYEVTPMVTTTPTAPSMPTVMPAYP
ncbi:MAG: S8 family serine peptidase [Caldilineaceae bacterium]